MNYSKPEVTRLGTASLLIQGVDGKIVEPSSDPPTYVYATDCELDD